MRSNRRIVEVIAVDDGSTDDSREIIARFDSRILPIIKSNGGQGSAMNEGFAKTCVLAPALASVMPISADEFWDAADGYLIRAADSSDTCSGWTSPWV